MSYTYLIEGRIYSLPGNVGKMRKFKLLGKSILVPTYITEHEIM